MRLAIICSFLNQYGGAERVLEVLHRMYPDAPFYTSVYRPEAFPETDRGWDVRTSFVNRLPMAKRRPQLYLAQYPQAFESFDLRAFDTVLSVTSSFAHGVITSSETRHICYCLTPTRFLWNYPAYIEREGIGRLARAVLQRSLKHLRMWDRLAADRVDEFVAISRTVQQRIAKIYRRDSTILYPPVQIGKLESPQEPEDYYLIVSRLIPYKRIDLAVEAFNRLGLPLYIAGEGRDKQKLQAMAKPNIRFLGYCSDDEKRRLMARCRAFIFPGEEDFGLAPLEAMAMGRPVIAYAAGGALDTVLDKQTGAFFTEPTPGSLAQAVTTLDTASFDPPAIQQHALQFDESVFSAGLRAILEKR
ncbi:MAG: glycosyltransferase [Chloroflexi bacterium]|nr:glycosyltransferase [Chloroflexota bacterium]